MLSCPACGGSSPAGASWCGQCFAALGPGPVAAAEPSRFGIAPAPQPALTAPCTAGLTAAPVVDRFGLPGVGPAVATLPASPAGPFMPSAEPTPMLSGKAIALVATCIAVGALGMGVSWILGRNERLEPETYIRYAIVLTLAVYAIVGTLIVTRLAPGHRLRWRVGNPARAILTGAAVGGGLSGLLLWGVSTAAGHLSPDPRIVTMMSEGDAPHIVVAVAIGCICAPLVEEVLFRGLLLESLRDRGRRVALLVSGAAFAVWHLNPAALRYYALMGVLLGALYLRRGLMCSMAAHAAFNGVLTVAALAVVLSPAKVVTAGGVSMQAPSGWSQVNDVAATLVLQGPSGAMVRVDDHATATPPSVDTINRRLHDGLLSVAVPGLQVDPSTIRDVTLPAGRAVEVDVTALGHRGTMVFLPMTDAALDVVFLSGGSAKAQADFPRMLDSLRIG